MKKAPLFNSLISFALSKAGAGLKFKYFLMGLTFYFLLSREGLTKKQDELSSGSQAGDDIYPLF